jgi:hypothetical protein
VLDQRRPWSSPVANSAFVGPGTSSKASAATTNSAYPNIPPLQRIVLWPSDRDERRGIRRIVRHAFSAAP